MKRSKGISTKNVAMTGNSGRVGNVRFVTKGDKTYTRTAKSQCSNPRTESQMRGRAKWLNIQNHWSRLKPFLADHFEGRTPSVSAYNLFTKRSSFCMNVFLKKNDEHCVSAPYGVSEGSLPVIGYNENADGILMSTVRVGDDFQPDENTTVGELADRILAFNEEFELGDELEFLGTVQNRGASLTISVHKETIVLETWNKEKLYSAGREWGFCCVNGFLAMKNDTPEGCYCWIHIRRDNSGENVKVSTQNLFNRNKALLEQYTSEEAFKKAVETYGK